MKKLIILIGTLFLTLSAELNAENNSDFYLHENGVTVICNVAATGETGEVNGVVYTKRTRAQLDEIIENENFELLETTCTSDIVDMSSLFNRVEFEADISHWDVSSVTDMNLMFFVSRNFNGDINSWDVSNVVNMSRMFESSSFNSDIGDWDVSNVVTMQRMFRDAGNFDQDINGWNVSNVENMDDMFRYAEAFNQDISGWNTGNVSTMARMFYGAHLFNQDIGNWDVSRVENMRYMFYFTLNFNQDLSGWDVSNVRDMRGLFRFTFEFNGDISSWDVSNVEDMREMFMDAKSFDQDINTKEVSKNGRTYTAWDVSNVENMRGMFFRNDIFNQDIGNWDVSGVTTFWGMFVNAKSFNQDLSSWNPESAFSLYTMFSGAEQFSSNLGEWNISQATDVREMFHSTGLTVQQYDQTLMGWAGQELQSNLTLGANGLRFCESIDARQHLINTYGWTINDEGLADGCEAAPAVLTLISPHDLEDDIAIQPEFSWNVASGADSYEFELSTDTDFEGIEVHVTNLMETGYSLDESLNYESVYYWRIRAENEFGLSDWSEPWSFTTEIDPDDLIGPDLIVSEISAPATAFSGRDIEISWTITNQGEEGTFAPIWYDGVFLDEQELGRTSNVSYLSAGESYTQEFTVTVPIDASGSKELSVRADIRNDQEEPNSENNVSEPLSITIEQSPYADLQVTSITAPPTAFSGDSIDIGWTIENFGTGPADVDYWYDSIFLTENEDIDFDFAGLNENAIVIHDTFLGMQKQEGPLQPGESYTVWSRVQLPFDEFGSLNLFVYADIEYGSLLSFDQVYEYNYEFNNWLGESIEIILTPPPDLIVTEINAATSLASGEVFPISWEVENQGPGNTRGDYWRDVVFFSDQEEFDPGSAEILSNTVYNADDEPLAPDESYIQSAEIQIPNGVSGQYYMHVYTDFGNRIFEHEYDDNNLTTLGPLSVELSPYPNLVTSSVIASDNAKAGDRIRVDWEVENSGPVPSGIYRSDAIYFSGVNSFNPQTVIQASKVSIDGVLEPGQKRSHSYMVRVPAEIEGEYFLFVQANADSTFFEYPDFNDNIQHSDALQVDPYPVVDLALRELQVPESLSSGETIVASWMVENIGEGTTLTDSWQDIVFMSDHADREFNADEDIIIAVFDRTSELEGGEFYQRTRDIKIPDGLDGEYYLIVSTYADSLTGDTNRSNNILSTEEPLEVELSSPVDLVVEGTDAPESVHAGEIVSFTWTVRNQGEGATSDRWFDAIYISDNDELSNSAVQLFSHEQNVALSSGDFYDVQAEIQIPSNLTGERFLIISTDIRDDIYEHEAEDNNELVHPLTIDSVLPADLVVQNVTIPETAAAGEDVTISWTVKNEGDNPARGRIREGVYVTMGDKVESSSQLLGVIDRDIDLSPGASTEVSMKIDPATTFQADSDGNITAPLPGLAPGGYKVAVRTNMRNSVRETSLSNNTGFSPGHLEVSIQELLAGPGISATLSGGLSRFYKFHASDNQDVEFRINSSFSGVVSARIYVRYGNVPTQSEYDAKSIEPFRVDQATRIPVTEEGTYYVMVRLDDAEADEIDLTVEAEILEFGVREASPAYGGNTGVVTTYIDGSKFQDDSKVFLEDRNGNRHPAYEQNVISSTLIQARFDLKGKETGNRNIVIVAPDDSETIFINGFEVVTGVHREPIVRVSSYPSNVRSQDDFEIEITITNPGTNNLLDYFLILENHAFINTASGPKAPFTFRIESEFYQIPDEFMTLLNHTQISLNREYFLHSPYWFYEMAPGAEYTITVSVIHSVLGPGWLNHFASMVAMPESDFTESGKIEDIESSIGFQMLLESRMNLIDELTRVSAGKMATDNQLAEATNDLVDMVVSLAGGFEPGPAMIGGIIGGGAALLIAGALAKPAAVTLTAFKLGTMVGTSMGTIYSFINIKNESIEEGTNAVNNHVFDPLTNRDKNRTEVRGSYDPNDIIGPEGYGDEQWIGVNESHRYKIRYENDPEEANAPAQTVLIRHPLDESLDIRSFRLGTYGFGDLTFTPESNVSFINERLDVREEYGLYVDVTAGIDVNSGEVFWLFRSLDPETMDLPSDPLAGYLPVNDSTGVGEGFVDYSIRVDSETSTGERINAEASIYFDDNPPIDTPPIFNTVDADRPISTIESFVASGENETTLELTWSDSDIGSGMRGIDLYVSASGGPFTLLERDLKDAPYLFTANDDTEYQFFSIATDNAGNREAMKDEGDLLIGTHTEEILSDIPNTFELHSNYPNPFNPTTTIPYDLPEAGDVSITIYNVIGQRILSYQLGRFQAGSHRKNVDMSRFASGVYLIELTVTGDAQQLYRSVQAMTLIK